MSRPVSRRQEALLRLLLIAATAYGAVYIYRTSFAIEGERFFTLFDDAMISMRYARNLAQGHGLVWNPGEAPVEGFTNPLWTGFMALVHLLPLPASKTSLPVQLAGLGLLLGTALQVRRVALCIRGVDAGVALFASALCAFSYPLIHWSLQGVEVGLLAFLLTAATADVLGRPAGGFPRRAYALGALAVLTRMDAALAFALLAAFAAHRDAANRRRHAWAAALALAGPLLALTLFRLGYYGEWLPNTWYLKMTGHPLGLRLSSGLWSLVEMLLSPNGLVLLVFLAAFRFSRDPALRVAGLLVGGQAAYHVYVGGDAWDDIAMTSRYLCMALPLFFVPLAFATDQILLRLAGRRRTGLTLAALLVVLVAANARSPLRLAEWAMWAEPLHAGSNREMVERARVIRQITRDDAVVAVVWAGATPYFSDRTCIDLLGRSDRAIARGPSRVPDDPWLRYTGFKPGHTKWDYDDSIGRRRPDLISQLWLPTLEEVERLVSGPYMKAGIGAYDYWLRRDSPRIRWEKLRIGPP